MIAITNKEKELLFNISINIYQYGSIIYGSYRENFSDIDYIVIVPDNLDYPEQMFCDKEQFNIYKRSEWINMCENGEIPVVETAFLNKKFVIKETEKFNINLSVSNIRKQFSAIASNSFVKAKKKLTIEKDFDPYIAKKSLWHSLRLLMFQKQLLKEKQIYDYSEANYLYIDIVENPVNDWNFYKQKYQSLYNSLKSECRFLEQSQIEK